MTAPGGRPRASAGRPRAALLALAGALVGCARSAAPAPTPDGGTAAPKVVARVNGRALTEMDLLVRQRTDPHGAEAGQSVEAALDALVLQELAAQAAKAEGLDRDPALHEEQRLLEAQVQAARRRALAQRYVQREVARRAAVSDEQLRAFYDAHVGELGLELRVHQILRRSRADIERALAALQAGQPFEQVFTEGAALPAGATPWDLGFLAWQQLPSPWRPVVFRLKDGEVSPIIEGPGGRFWLVKVVARREGAPPPLEQVGPGLRRLLEAERGADLKDEVEASLRASGRVERPAP